MRYAVASTAWSLPSTWDGGLTIPAAGEAVHANGFNVNIDMDITVLSLNTSASGAAAAGGGFTVTAGGRVINANIIPGTTVCLTVSHASGTVTINGDVLPPSTVNAITFSGAGTLDVNGNITAGTTGDGINCIGGGDINLVGNLTGGTGAAGNGIIVTTNPADITVVGTITGGSSTTAYGLTLTGSGGGTLVHSGGNIVGGPTSTGGSAILAAGVRFDMDITGNIVPSASSYVINHTCADSVITVVGDMGGFNGVLGGSSLSITGANTTVTLTGAFVGTIGGGTGVVLAFAGAGASATLNGNVSGGTGICLSISATGTVTLNGDVVSGTTTHGVSWVSAPPGVFIVNGNVTNQATVANMYGLSLTGTGTVTVNGNSTGGANMVQGANGVHSTGIGATVTITGVCTGGTGSNATYGANFTAVGTYKVGTAKSNNYPNDGLTQPNVGVNCSAGVSCTLDALEYGSGGGPPHSQAGYFFVRAAGTNTCKMRESNAGAVYTMGDLVNDFPVAGDVRFNVTYNSGSQVGTCHVPGAASTLVGVLVDNTVGTAAVTSAAISSAVWDFLTASAVTPDSFGALVKLLALTTDVTAAQAAIIAAVNSTESDIGTAITNSQTAVIAAVNSTEADVIAAVNSSEADVIAALGTIDLSSVIANDNANTATLAAGIASAIAATNASEADVIAAVNATEADILAAVNSIDMSAILTAIASVPLETWNVLLVAAFDPNTMGDRMKDVPTALQMAQLMRDNYP